MAVCYILNIFIVTNIYVVKDEYAIDAIGTHPLSSINYAEQSWFAYAIGWFKSKICT